MGLAQMIVPEDEGTTIVDAGEPEPRESTDQLESGKNPREQTEEDIT